MGGAIANEVVVAIIVALIGGLSALGGAWYNARATRRNGKDANAGHLAQSMIERVAQLEGRLDANQEQRRVLDNELLTERTERLQQAGRINALEETAALNRDAQAKLEERVGHLEQALSDSRTEVALLQSEVAQLKTSLGESEALNAEALGYVERLLDYVLERLGMDDAPPLPIRLHPFISQRFGGELPPDPSHAPQGSTS